MKKKRNCQSSQWINRLWDWYRSRVEMNIVCMKLWKKKFRITLLSKCVPATVPSVYFLKRVKMWLKAVELPLVQYPPVMFRKKPLKIFFSAEKVNLLSSSLPHLGFLSWACCLLYLNIVSFPSSAVLIIVLLLARYLDVGNLPPSLMDVRFTPSVNSLLFREAKN